MLFTVKTITWIALIGINDNGHFRYGTYSVPKKIKTVIAVYCESFRISSNVPVK